jgi:hypothetical protein
LYVAAETKLLAYLRRRLQVHQLFPGVDLPADLAHQLNQWTGPPPRRPPTPASVVAMKMIRALVAVVAVEMAALVMIGVIILLAAAAWQFLTGGAP